MDRQTLKIFAAVLGFMVMAVAVVVLTGGGNPGPPADAPFVDGVVIKVDATSLTDVKSFTLRTDDGRSLVLGVSGLQNAVQFPPGHLNEHLATSARMRVWYRETSAGLDAVWMEDITGR